MAGLDALAPPSVRLIARPAAAAVAVLSYCESLASADLEDMAVHLPLAGSYRHTTRGNALPVPRAADPPEGSRPPVARTPQGDSTARLPCGLCPRPEGLPAMLYAPYDAPLGDGRSLFHTASSASNLQRSSCDPVPNPPATNHDEPITTPDAPVRPGGPWRALA